MIKSGSNNAQAAFTHVVQSTVKGGKGNPTPLVSPSNGNLFERIFSSQKFNLKHGKQDLFQNSGNNHQEEINIARRNRKFNPTLYINISKYRSKHKSAAISRELFSQFSKIKLSFGNLENSRNLISGGSIAQRLKNSRMNGNLMTFRNQRQNGIHQESSQVVTIPGLSVFSLINRRIGLTNVSSETGSKIMRTSGVTGSSHVNNTSIHAQKALISNKQTGAVNQSQQAINPDPSRQPESFALRQTKNFTGQIEPQSADNSTISAHKGNVNKVIPSLNSDAPDDQIKLQTTVSNHGSDRTDAMKQQATSKAAAINQSITAETSAERSTPAVNLTQSANRTDQQGVIESDVKSQINIERGLPAVNLEQSTNRISQQGVIEPGVKPQNTLIETGVREDTLNRQSHKVQESSGVTVKPEPIPTNVVRNGAVWTTQPDSDISPLNIKAAPTPQQHVITDQPVFQRLDQAGRDNRNRHKQRGNESRSRARLPGAAKSGIISENSPEKQNEANPERVNLNTPQESVQKTFANLNLAAKSAYMKHPEQGSFTNQHQLQNTNELVSRIQMSVREGSQELLIHLKPNILGRAVILFRQDKENLVLEFTLDNDNARQAIESEASKLRDALTSAGFQNVSIDVKTSDSNSSRASTPEPDQQRRQDSGNRKSDQNSDDHTEQNLPEKPKMLGYNTFELIA